MSTNEKQHQLSQIKTYHFQDLISFIDTDAITLTEMINAGLSTYTVEDINQHPRARRCVNSCYRFCISKPSKC